MASFSDDEVETLLRIARGPTGPGSVRLGISEATVATHLSKVYRKTGLGSRTELARESQGRGA